MRTRVYRVDNEDGDVIASRALVARLNNTPVDEHNDRRVHDFLRNQNPITKGIQDFGYAQYELEHVFFLGHTHTVEGRNGEIHFSGFTAKKFAAHIDSSFKSSFKNRSARLASEDRRHLKHIYIVGCEAGMDELGESNSFAQRLANALKAIDGYPVNLQVHAVHYEKKNPDERIYVQVIDRPALMGDSAIAGDIDAHILPAEHARMVEATRKLVNQKRQDKINETDPREQDILNRQIKEYGKEIDNAYAAAKKHRDAYIEAGHPLEILSRAENTFIAGESYQQRMQRIQADEGYQIRQEKKQAVAVLRAHSSKLNGNSDGDKIHLLSRLISRLKTTLEKTYQVICAEYLQRFRDLSVLGAVKEPDNETYKLVKDLSQGKLQEHVAQVDDAEQEYKSESQPLITGPTSRGGASGLYTTHPALMKSIKDHKELLEKEIKDLRKRSNSCWYTVFSYFTSYEILTKTDKKECMEYLLTARSMSELQQKAQQALDDKESQVNRQFINTSTWEYGVSRTTDLLKGIVTKPDALELAGSEAQKLAKMQEKVENTARIRAKYGIGSKQQ